MFNVAHASTLPLQGTEVAKSWDALYNFLVGLSVFFFIIVVFGMIFFAFKYRERAGNRAKYITGSHALETAWTLIPTVLLLIIFGWGYAVYNRMTNAPGDAMEIRVVGKQWLWVFQYDDGRTTTNELYVPVNQPVKLIMSSEDVIHSFFIPNFRVKQDVVPGMYTSVWFEATVPGKHQVYCAEYCGATHSGMLAQLIALEPEQWNAWKRGRQLGAVPKAGETLQAGSEAAASVRLASLPEQGKALFQAKGCVACHSDDGTQKVGPTLKGLMAHPVELTDGSKVKADENYIRESIENPNAKMVKGFNPVMPTFKGLLSEMEMNALVAYIRSLSGAESSAEAKADGSSVATAANR